MFTPAGNQAVACLLAEMAEQMQRWKISEASLLHPFRIRCALLGLQHPEVYDTAVRDELWPCLLAMGFSEAFIHAALVYAPPAELLFGLSSPPLHQPGETLAQMQERLRSLPSQDEETAAQAAESGD